MIGILSKKLFTTIGVGVLILAFFVSPAPAQAQRAGLIDAVTDGVSQDELQNLVGKPQQRIEIPGVNLGDIQIDNEGVDTYLVIPFLSEYIKSAYRYAVITISIISIIVIIISGLQWTVSGGSQDVIGSAKKRIAGSLTGLLLAIGSYTILYLINPDLVNFRSLRVKFIVEQEIVDEFKSRALSESAQTTVNVPGVSGSSPVASKADVAKYSSPFTDNSWCEVSNPSTQKSNLVGVNFQYFGSLDCLSGDKYRPIGQIESIVLHDGWKALPRSGYVDSLEKRYNQPIKNLDVYSQLNYWRQEKIKSGGSASSHYTIAQDGVIYQTLDHRKVGWHAPGQNNRSIGIDLIYNKSNSPRYTEAQYESLARLLTSLKSQLPSIQQLKDSTVHGHGDCQDTRNDPNYFDFEKLGELLPGSSFDNDLHERVRHEGHDFSEFCKYVFEKGKTRKGPAS